MSGYYTQVPDDKLDYRDSRDLAHVQVRNLVRRVLNKVDAYIALEHSRASLEGRSVGIDLTPDGLKRLIVKYTVQEYGGGQVAAINSANETPSQDS